MVFEIISISLNDRKIRNLYTILIFNLRIFGLELSINKIIIDFIR